LSRAPTSTNRPATSLAKVLRIPWLLTFAVCGWGQAGAQHAGTNPNFAMADGSIHGVVTSADGAVYEGARVALTQSGASAGPAAMQQTDTSGAFDFSGLPAGAFRLTISSHGFETQEIDGQLGPGQAFDARTIVLPVANASSEVTVSAESQVEIAQAQLNLEEKQRVLGVVPNYYVSYDHNAVPLTTRQKYQLAWRTSIDPVTFLLTGAVAGVEQAHNTFAGYAQGASGYAKRFGATYADGFIGTMIGGAILNSWLKQDPRYFYKGTGSVTSRALYAIARSVVCKSDSGHWQPAYSAIIGGLAAGGISNLYYPSGDRSGVKVIFVDAGIGTAESALQNLVQEFIVRKLTPRVPDYALADAP
jgi:Carboxypeptidase regulatory-like domain